jgi:hypothetical protein
MLFKGKNKSLVDRPFLNYVLLGSWAPEYRAIAGLHKTESLVRRAFINADRFGLNMVFKIHDLGPECIGYRELLASVHCH